jgi:hypothetical protein
MFDIVASSFAIHHLTMSVGKCFTLVFPILILMVYNLDHFSSPIPRLHERFMVKLGKTPERIVLTNY